MILIEPKLNLKSKSSAEKSPYLELLKKVLIDFDKIGTMEHHPLNIVKPNWKTSILYPLDKLLRIRNFAITKLKFVDQQRRLNGLDWPANAKTMIGIKRLTNIEQCIRLIKQQNIEGDLIETGVWRGGAVMFMKAVLNELKINDKVVWVADSFNGIPQPRHPEDRQSRLHEEPILKATLLEVQENFKRFDLLDENVKFIEGWFTESLPNVPIQKLALLRLDGDLYESTHVALEHLYPKLSVGGFIIIDDYNAFPFCKKAVNDYRVAHKIEDPIIDIDKEAVFWQKKN